MPDISTLVPDIYRMISNKNGWFTDEIASSLGREISTRLQVQLGERFSRPTLRLSQMGPRCPKALWHSIHTPEQAEPLPPYAEIKYSFGHTIEALALALAKAAGHSVTGEQDELRVDDITGHRDCVIDGCIVDVKSASSFSFKKFKDGSIRQDDPFGYLDQLDGYLVGSSDDPLVTVKDRGYLLAIDKQLGHMCIYEHRLRIAPDGTPAIKQRIQQYKDIVRQPVAPTCNCTTVADGKSGNYRLDTRASYSPYKHICFPNLRTFLYASGPVYLSKVVRVPDVMEITSHGHTIH